MRLLNASTTGHPFLGDKLLGIGAGRGLGTLKGFSEKLPNGLPIVFLRQMLLAVRILCMFGLSRFFPTSCVWPGHRAPQSGSTGVDEGRKGRILLVKKKEKLRHVALWGGGGRRACLGDPGSELRLGRETENKKRKKKKGEENR